MTQTVGEQLRLARQERGLSIAQASRATRIREHFLEALEEGELEALPSRVQAKGFLRNYAAYLGLPVQLLLDIWDGKKPAPTPESAVPATQAVSAPSPVFIPAGEPTAAEPERTEKAPPVIAEQPLASSQTSEVLQTSEVSAVAPVSPPAALPPSGVLLADIGGELRRQRELLGLSLADVERHTHVRQRYLEAMEDGRLSDLPSPVQGRGMLHNYAHFLDLDSDRLLLTFADALQTRLQEKNTRPFSPAAGGQKRPARKAAQVATWRRFITPDLLVVGALIMALFVFAIWAASQIGSLQAQPVAATPPSIAEMLLQTQSPVALPTTSPTGPVSVGTRMAQGQPTSAPAAAAGTPTITLPAGVSGPVQVVVVARQRAYLRVTVDGKVAFDGRVNPGNAYPFGGEKRIELLIGSAAAFQVFYNQTDLGSLGLVGEVRTLLFSKDSVTTPTPQFTPTRTATAVPSPTLKPSATLPTPTITPYIP